MNNKQIIKTYKIKLLRESCETIGCGDWFLTKSKRQARARMFHINVKEHKHLHTRNRIQLKRLGCI